MDAAGQRAILARTTDPDADVKACGPGVKAVFAGENAYPQSQGTTKGTVSQIDTAETFWDGLVGYGTGFALKCGREWRHADIDAMGQEATSRAWPGYERGRQLRGGLSTS
jgi:hypothetical protein